MLKSDLLQSIHKKYPSLSLSDIEILTNLFFDKILMGLKEGKNIEIRGFGTFA